MNPKTTELMQAARLVLSGYGGLAVPLYAMPDNATCHVKGKELKRLNDALEACEKEVRKQAIKDLQDPEKTTTVVVDGMELVFPKLPAWMGEGNPG